MLVIDTYVFSRSLFSKDIFEDNMFDAKVRNRRHQAKFNTLLEIKFKLNDVRCKELKSD